MTAGLRATLLDPRFLAWALAWSLGSLLVFGLVSAIIPNPVFGREIPPEPFAIWVWLASAPLMGLLGATYTAPPPRVPLGVLTTGTTVERERGGALGTFASFGTFLAIGCPVCNKLALIALGTSGAMTVWAPIQPVVGAVSIVLLIAALGWRVRTRARGGACTPQG